MSLLYRIEDSPQLAAQRLQIIRPLLPHPLDGEPQPVHRYLIRTHGLPILEWVYLEDLAADKAFEFLFLALPLNIRGATGSLVRPVALV